MTDGFGPQEGHRARNPQLSKCHQSGKRLGEGGGEGLCVGAREPRLRGARGTGTPAERTGRGEPWASRQAALACRFTSPQRVVTEKPWPTALYFLLLLSPPAPFPAPLPPTSTAERPFLQGDLPTPVPGWSRAPACGPTSVLHRGTTVPPACGDRRVLTCRYSCHPFRWEGK